MLNNNTYCNSSGVVVDDDDDDDVNVNVNVGIDDVIDDSTTTTTTIIISSSPTTISCYYYNYIINYLWPGLGLFGESYILFSIGTLIPIWKILYPNCFNNSSSSYYDSNNDDSNFNNDNDASYTTYYSCHPRLIHSLTYSAVIGIIIGMILLGYISNIIGRKYGSIITSFLMFIGCLGLVILSTLFTTSNSSTDDDDDNDDDTDNNTNNNTNNTNTDDVVFLFRGIVISLFIFGIGVGGEYPLSASLASEKAIIADTDTDTEESQIIMMTQQQQQTHQTHQTHQTQTLTDYFHQDSKKIPLVNNNNNNNNNNNDNDNDDVMAATATTAEIQNQSQKHIPGLRGRGRGRSVQLVFANQGLGIWFNSLTMLLLFTIIQIGNNNDNNDNNNDNANNDDGNGNDNDDDNNNAAAYTKGQLLMVWRITYIIGLLILFFVFISRILYLKESKIWLDSNSTRNAAASTTSTSTSSRKKSSNSSSDADGGAGDGAGTGDDNNNNNNNNNNNTDGILRGTIAEMETNNNTKPHNNNNLQLFHQQYGMRLFGASMSWLLWDISFYGNKLFQSTFILALFAGSNNASIIQLTSASFLNATVALIGYYCAAYIIELPWLGRTKLQSIGFLLTGTLFILCGMIISSSSSSSSGSNDESKTKTYIMVSMYLLSSFIGQLGPNCTTFIIPTEIFPTEQRTYAHGICAASGKVGALIAAIIFHFISSPTSNSGNYGNDGSGGEQEEQEQDQQQYLLFYICGYTSFVACLITICFIPETNNLNLLELDLQWNNMVYQKQQQQEEEEEGQQQQQQYNSSYSYHYYNGPANHPDHLSLYERWIKQKQNKTYNS